MILWKCDILTHIPDIRAKAWLRESGSHALGKHTEQEPKIHMVVFPKMSLVCCYGSLAIPFSRKPTANPPKSWKACGMIL